MYVNLVGWTKRRYLRRLFTPSGFRSASAAMLETDYWPPEIEYSLGRPIVCLPEAKWVWSASDVRLINQSNCLSRKTLGCSLFSGLTLGSLERNFINDNIHSANSTKLHWGERQPGVTKIEWRIDFLLKLWGKVVAVSGNTGSAPLIEV